MGFLANYMMVDKPTLDRLIDTDGDELTDAIDELEDAGQNEIYCMDKLWDGLHFLLTGVSASDPIEDNQLSEAIVGVHIFDCEDFVGDTKSDEVAPIVAALEKVDIDKLLKDVDFSQFKKKEVYPNIWTNNDKASLANELREEYRNLLDFYRKALAAKANVVVSIY